MKATVKETRRRFVLAAASGVGMLAAVSPATPLWATDSSLWGDLVGRFVYDGTPPARKKLKVEKDVSDTEHQPQSKESTAE